jgi:hypothetical protein
MKDKKIEEKFNAFLRDAGIINISNDKRAELLLVSKFVYKMVADTKCSKI